VTREAAVVPLRPARNVPSLVIVKGDVPGIEDAGEFHASLARHKRYSLMLLGQSERTVNERIATVRRLNRWLRRERGIGALEATEDDLLDWAMNLTLKVNSRATEIIRVRGFYRWRHEVEHVPTDPAAGLPLPEQQPSEPNPIEDEVLTRAVQLARELTDWRIMVALVLAAFAGLRIGEIARLRREDFRRARDGRVVIHVVGKGRGGGKHRDVPISPDVFDILVECGLPNRGPIMPRRDGQPGSLPASAASWLLNSFLHTVVGTGYTIHDVRDWFATELYDETRNVLLVQRLMGHASAATTNGYVKIVEARREEAVDTLDDRLPDLGLASVHDLEARRRKRGGQASHLDEPRRGGRPAGTVISPLPGICYEPEAVSCRRPERRDHHDRIR
jgi:integrase